MELPLQLCRFRVPSPAGLRKPLRRERSSGARGHPRRCFLRVLASEIQWAREHRWLVLGVAALEAPTEVRAVVLQPPVVCRRKALRLAAACLLVLPCGE